MQPWTSLSEELIGDYQHVIILFLYPLTSPNQKSSYF